MVTITALGDAERRGVTHYSTDDENGPWATLTLRDTPYRPGAHPAARPESCEVALSDGRRFGGELTLPWCERRIVNFLLGKE